MLRSSAGEQNQDKQVQFQILTTTAMCPALYFSFVMPEKRETQKHTVLHTLIWLHPTLPAITGTLIGLFLAPAADLRLRVFRLHNEQAHICCQRC